MLLRRCANSSGQLWETRVDHVIDSLWNMVFPTRQPNPDVASESSPPRRPTFSCFTCASNNLITFAASCTAEWVAVRTWQHHTLSTTKGCHHSWPYRRRPCEHFVPALIPWSPVRRATFRRHATLPTDPTPLVVHAGGVPTFTPQQVSSNHHGAESEISPASADQVGSPHPGNTRTSQGLPTCLETDGLATPIVGT